MPPNYDGCGGSLNMEHALDCCVDGLVSQHHNEVQGAIGDLSSLVWKQVQKEPVVCESTIDDSTSENLIADLRVRGIWEPQVDAIFDVYVFDTDALHIAVILLKLFFGLQKSRRKASTLQLVKHAMLVLYHFALVLIVYLVVKQIFFIKHLAHHLAASGENYTALLWIG